jgi:hypothetical protein
MTCRAEILCGNAFHPLGARGRANLYPYTRRAARARRELHLPRDPHGC